MTDENSSIVDFYPTGKALSDGLQEQLFANQAYINPLDMQIFLSMLMECGSRGRLCNFLLIYKWHVYHIFL